jgi:hypothetical protein
VAVRGPPRRAGRFGVDLCSSLCMADEGFCSSIVVQCSCLNVGEALEAGQSNTGKVPGTSVGEGGSDVVKKEPRE